MMIKKWMLALLACVLVLSGCSMNQPDTKPAKAKVVKYMDALQEGDFKKVKALSKDKDYTLMFIADNAKENMYYTVKELVGDEQKAEDYGQQYWHILVTSAIRTYRVKSVKATKKGFKVVVESDGINVVSGVLRLDEEALFDQIFDELLPTFDENTDENQMFITLVEAFIKRAEMKIDEAGTKKIEHVFTLNKKYQIVKHKG